MAPKNVTATGITSPTAPAEACGAGVILPDPRTRTTWTDMDPDVLMAANRKLPDWLKLDRDTTGMVDTKIRSIEYYRKRLLATSLNAQRNLSRWTGSRKTSMNCEGKTWLAGVSQENPVTLMCFSKRPTNLRRIKVDSRPVDKIGLSRDMSAIKRIACVW